MTTKNSAQKAARVAQRKAERNKPIRSSVKTYVTKARRLILENDLDAAQEAVKQAIIGYVNAINSKDAKAASSCWSDTGVWIGPDGMEITGRAAIEKHMAELFAAGQMPSIELVDVHVRFIAPNVATEEGHVIVTNPNATPHKASYISIHVRTPEGWKLDSVRETLIADDIGNHIYLRELDWMIGTWKDERL